MIGQPAPHILLLNPEPAAITSLQALHARKKPLEAGFLQRVAESTALHRTNPSSSGCA